MRRDATQKLGKMRFASRLIVAFAGACLLAGCAINGDATRSDAIRSESSAPWSLLRDAARAKLIARLYDNGVQAAQVDDASDVLKTCRRLRALRAMPEAVALASQVAVDESEKAIYEGLALDSRAQPGDEESASASDAIATPDELRTLAARQYRRALQLSPRFDSFDPEKSNALAWFLAERGTDKRDFSRSEELARRSVQLWDETIAQGIERGYHVEVWRLSRAESRDTLAWALFRRGDLENALREQQSALSEAQQILPLLSRMPAFGVRLNNDKSGELQAELLFHLGEILRALKRTDQARAQFQAALKIVPDHATSRKSLREMDDEAKRP